MIVRVILPLRIETAFRKAAIAAYPHEHAEAIRGRVVGDTVTITRLTQISPKSAGIDRVDYLNDDAVAPGYDAPDTFIGVVHSHPGENVDGAPSVTDWKSAFECGEIVMGILTVEPRGNGKFKTGLNFYEVRPPIAIIHPRVRKARKHADAKSPAVPSTSPDAIDPNVRINIQSETQP